MWIVREYWTGISVGLGTLLEDGVSRILVVDSRDLPYVGPPVGPFPSDRKRRTPFRKYRSKVGRTTSTVSPILGPRWVHPTNSKRTTTSNPFLLSYATSDRFRRVFTDQTHVEELVVDVRDRGPGIPSPISSGNPRTH